MIAVDHLTKFYGQIKAVDNICFEVDEGHVYASIYPAQLKQH